MVDFLLDNTLGAWHAGKVLASNPQLASTAQTEDDLRQAVALPGCPWSYLRLIKTDDGLWAPAAGVFEGWPMAVAELKCLDPCMGSGHFVVAMFERLVGLRIEEEGMSEKVAVSAVIQGNLFGLEIDPRCTQIATFNLALAAWRRIGHYRLPAMNLACSGLAPNATEAEWLDLAGDNERIRNGMGRLYRLFDKAAVLGSLINPRAGEADLLVADFQELRPLLEQALVHDSKDEVTHELSVTAGGLAKAAEILAGQFTLVATNVPYLGRGKQDEVLQDYCGQIYPEAKADLATAFVERCLEFCATQCSHGTTAIVTPQNWISLGSFRKLRTRLLSDCCFKVVAQLGPAAFQDMNWWGANTLLIIYSSEMSSASSSFGGIDVSAPRDPAQKACLLLSSSIEILNQRQQLENPDNRLIISHLDSHDLLGKAAIFGKGSVTGDGHHYLRSFWEFDRVAQGCRYWLNSPSKNQQWGGREQVVLWQLDGFNPRSEIGFAERGQRVLGQTGIAIAKMNHLHCTRYEGELFDDNLAALIPSNANNLSALWTFCTSPEFKTTLRLLEPKMAVTAGTFVKVPFDLAHWQEVAAEKYPHGLPKPFSSDPTQWLFSGHPAGADQPLHVALARLLSYLWPRQTGSGFPDCPALDPDGLESLADQDGIVCLSPTRGEAAAVDRLRGLLAAAFGDEWSNARERELLLETAVANDAKKAAADLSDWLRQNFFAEHCKLYQSRPFIWQIWDGNPHGFSALVNYHKLAAPKGQGRKTLELLTFTYLGDWIDSQKLDQAEGVNGADDRLAAALDLQGQLKKILEGEPPYDIFVRWKPLHKQPIGWDPDINDGVRLNIRPFLNAQLRKGGKAGAGILRAKPGTIKWTKDRGKTPKGSKADFPWFWGWEEKTPAVATDFGAPIPGAPPAGDSFDGNRWNDLHYTRAAKEAARARHRDEG